MPKILVCYNNHYSHKDSLETLLPDAWVWLSEEEIKG